MHKEDGDSAGSTMQDHPPLWAAWRGLKVQWTMMTRAVKVVEVTPVSSRSVADKEGGTDAGGGGQSRRSR